MNAIKTKAVTTKAVTTKVLKASAESIKFAAEIIKRGGLAAFPTETVYGLGADGLDGQAVLKIFEAKGRPADNPLILHIAESSALEDSAVNIPSAAWELAKAFWPGPLTMILKKHPRVPYEVTAGLETAAIRCPDNITALSLINEAGRPVAAPSANRSGHTSPTTAEHVLSDLDGRISVILDGGECSGGIESTIIDLSSDKPVILRPGLITGEEIERVLNLKLSKYSNGGEAPKAPGMKYAHYAPKVKVTIVTGEDNERADYINRLCALCVLCGIICSTENKHLYKSGEVKAVGSKDNPNEIARNIYAALRELDKPGVTRIFCEGFYGTAVGGSIMNRLEKAAGYDIIHLEKGING